jgi:hypothetical protein
MTSTQARVAQPMPSLLAAGQVLDPVAAAGAVDDEEGDVMIGVARRLPRAVRQDLAGEPHAVRRHAAAVIGHEGDLAGRHPADAVGGGDHQVPGRAVHHARGAEMPAELAAGHREQGTDGGRPIEERPSVGVGGASGAWRGGVPMASAIRVASRTAPPVGVITTMPQMMAMAALTTQMVWPASVRAPRACLPPPRRPSQRGRIHPPARTLARPGRMILPT